MSKRRYGWDADYDYDERGGNEHYVVALYRLNGKGNRWKPLERWRYSTAKSREIALAKASRRIQKLRERYSAEEI